jgi:hypothetical protein
VPLGVEMPQSELSPDSCKMRALAPSCCEQQRTRSLVRLHPLASWIVNWAALRLLVLGVLAFVFSAAASRPRLRKPSFLMRIRQATRMLWRIAAGTFRSRSRFATISASCVSTERLRFPPTLRRSMALFKAVSFVVRSAGGDARVAVQLADILRGKQAIVIVNDYCLANCANYLFIASFTTYVPKDALVAWRFVSEPRVCIDLSGEHRYEAPRFSPCNSSFHDGRRNEEIDQLKRKFSEGRALSSEPSRAGFLRDGPRHQDFSPSGPSFELPPRSAAVVRALKEIVDARGGLPPIFWTWNPRFYPTVITTRVFYEAYPQSQDEVDAIAKRIWLGARVIYDP